MKEKRPWYVWLSAFGYWYLMVPVLAEKGLRMFGWAAYGFAGQFMLPTVLLLGFWEQIPWPGSGARMAGLLVCLLVLYGAGVMMTIRLDRQLRGKK